MEKLLLNIRKMIFFSCLINFCIDDLFYVDFESILYLQGKLLILLLLMILSFLSINKLNTEKYPRWSGNLQKFQF